MQLHSKFGVLADFCVSLKRLKRIFFKISSNNLRNVYNVYTFNQFWEKRKKLVFLLFRRPNLVFAIFSSHPDWPVTLLSNFSNVIFKYIFLKLNLFPYRGSSLISFVFPMISRVSQNFKLFSCLTKCPPESVCRQFCNMSMHLQRQLHSFFWIVDSSAG